ncbi:acyl-CoA-binding domain-containing protein 4-like isoform X1, partial [Acipenser oxyrinchus oxyrinchus]
TGAAMAHPEQDCERRFRAAVSIVHSLPKSGVYRSSHEVMLRFYSFYKQATCGPCTAPRPGFWEVLFCNGLPCYRVQGVVSRVQGADQALLPQQVINTVPMNEKTASMFHYFQPLYSVIHDMPRPPDTLLQQTRGELESSVREEWSRESEPQGNGPVWGLSGHPDGGAEFNQESNHVTSDSESEVFCDSMEQLDPTKQGEPQSDSSAPERQSPLNPVAVATQAGAGQGGERAGQGEGEPMRKMGTLLDGRQSHWSERRENLQLVQYISIGFLIGKPKGSPECAYCCGKRTLQRGLVQEGNGSEILNDTFSSSLPRSPSPTLQGLSCWLPALLLWPFLAQWLIHLL